MTRTKALILYVFTFAFFLSTSFADSAYPPMYYPSHCHWTTGISMLGDTLELEDASVWSINPYDSGKIYSWSSRDPLVIYPQQNWFSSYKYKIHNKALGETIDVNLELSPIVGGDNTLSVYSIDPIRGEVVLDNQSIWRISNKDRNILELWAPEDLIIIGMNATGMFSNEKFILINVNMNNYCRVNVY